MTEFEKNLKEIEDMHKNGIIDKETYTHMINEIKQNMKQEEPPAVPPPPVTVVPPTPVPPPAAPPPPPAAAAPPPAAPPAPPKQNVPNRAGAAGQTSETLVIKPMYPPSSIILEMKNVSKVYDGGVRAADNINFTVGQKEFVVLLGPSGCGKSTLLNMIAGFDTITEGELFIDNESMNKVPVNSRNVAMVSQNYRNAEDKNSQKKRLELGALSFDIPVNENIAYDLQIRKVPKAEIDKRVNEAARMFDIEKLLARKLKALSRGQQCRVAMARAMVKNPKVFIFDDILSDLDPNFRVMMRAEFSDIHRKLNTAIIYATDDFTEAMSMADKIVVMKDGKIQQIESPMFLYNYPKNKFVARFMGNPQMSFLNVIVREEGRTIMLDEGSLKIEADPSHFEYLRKYAGKQIHFGIRPEDLIYYDYNASDSVKLKVNVVQPLGAEIHLWLTTETQPLMARMPPIRLFNVGDTVNFIPKMEKARYFDKDTELSILPIPV